MPTTIVAATVVEIIDRVAGTTSTTTLLNETPELSAHGQVRPIPPKNAKGTVVTTITVTDGIAHTQFTTVVAYPSPYLTYGYNVWVSGTLQTTASDGATGCMTLPTGSPLSLPSHPPWTEPLTTEFPKGGDEVGTNFLPHWEEGPPVDVLFPDFGPFKTCGVSFVAPAMVLYIATVLTETSTRYKDSDTVAIGKTPPSITSPTANAVPNLPPLTIGSQVVTPDYSSHYVVGTQTLHPGGPAVTISGTPISVPSAFALPLLTFGTQIITPDSLTRFVIGSQTVAPGSPGITVSGTPISVQVGGSAVVVGTSTEGLGNWIISGLGGIVTPADATKTVNGAAQGYSGPPSNGVESSRGRRTFGLLVSGICVFMCGLGLM